MSESVIADFVGTFNAEVIARNEPVPGRVICSQRRLVLVADADERLTIPLENVFDVAVGHVPEEMGDFFESTVTIAFRRDDQRHVAAVEADDDTITKFSTVLFKALLNGTAVSVAWRARVGGRVTDAGFEQRSLSVRSGELAFRGTDGEDVIDLATVTAFDRGSHEIGGRSRPTLEIDHVVGSETLTTYVAVPSSRKLSLIGRYLRLEYADILEELEDVDLGDEEKELLVAVYSMDDGMEVPLAAVLGVDGSRVTMLVEDLVESGLLVDADDGPRLTRAGQVVASRSLEDVNS